MRKLLEKYLNHKLEDIEPLIKYDEQHYRCGFKNGCCASGYDSVDVPLSEILVFLHTGVTREIYGTI